MYRTCTLFLEVHCCNSTERIDEAKPLKPSSTSHDVEGVAGIGEQIKALSVDTPHVPLPSSSSHVQTSAGVGVLPAMDACWTGTVAVGGTAACSSSEEWYKSACPSVGGPGGTPTLCSFVGLGDTPGHYLSGSTDSMEVHADGVEALFLPILFPILRPSILLPFTPPSPPHPPPLHLPPHPPPSHLFPHPHLAPLPSSSPYLIVLFLRASHPPTFTRTTPPILTT